MIFYVIKNNDKYLRYSEFGFGYKWVDNLTKATQFVEKKVAETCAAGIFKVVEVKVVEEK